MGITLVSSLYITLFTSPYLIRHPIYSPPPTVNETLDQYSQHVSYKIRTPITNTFVTLPHMFYILMQADILTLSL